MGKGADEIVQITSAAFGARIRAADSAKNAGVLLAVAGAAEAENSHDIASEARKALKKILGEWRKGMPQQGSPQRELLGFGTSSTRIDPSKSLGKNWKRRPKPPPQPQLTKSGEPVTQRGRGAV